MESDPEQQTSLRPHMFFRQSRLWSPGSSEAMNSRAASGRRFSLRRFTLLQKTRPEDTSGLAHGTLNENPVSGQIIATGVQERLCFVLPDDMVLLRMCDSTRERVQRHEGVGLRGSKLISVLEEILRCECGGLPTISLQTIRLARLDKLLSDVAYAVNNTDNVSAELQALSVTADGLQRQWTARFRGSYFELGHDRRRSLISTGGRLEHMEFDGSSPASRGFWKPRRHKRSDVDGNLPEGHWWLNIACAERDGILCDSDGAGSRRDFGDIPALPLMAGIEMAQWPSGQVRYTREGTMADMFLPLMTHIGRRVRVLRGPLLKSIFAPKAGVRYDGQYTIRQYGQKWNPRTGAHRLTLVLDRVEGQRPMHELVPVPRPSQMDDWCIFERLEDELVISQIGESYFAKWKMARMQDMIEMERFARFMQLDSTATLRKWVDQVKMNGGDTKQLEMVQKLDDLRWQR